MPDDPARAWQHPWLRVNRLFRSIRDTYWGPDTWLKAKKVLAWTLVELGRLRRSPWWN
jgi:hypothetical protein